MWCRSPRAPVAKCPDVSQLAAGCERQVCGAALRLIFALPPLQACQSCWATGRQVPAIEKEEYSSTLGGNYRGSSPACCDPCFPGGALHRIVKVAPAFSVGRARTQPRSSTKAARLKAIFVSACAWPECCLLLHSEIRGHHYSAIALDRQMLIAPPPPPPPTRNRRCRGAARRAPHCNSNPSVCSP